MCIRDRIEALGPLGNGFPLEEAEGKKVFLIGGGIGIPPMLETAKQLKAEKTAVLGYRDELFLNDEFTDVYKRQALMRIIKNSTVRYLWITKSHCSGST